MKEIGTVSFSCMIAGVGAGFAAWYISQKLSPGLAIAFVGGTLTAACLHIEGRIRELRELMDRR